jgi:site-specific DNA-methyltransferase (adenine-specific)
VAAAKVGRRYVGYDLDPAYVDIARARVQATQIKSEEPASARKRSASAAVTTPSMAKGGDDDFQARATREGKAAQAIAEQVLEDAGFTIVGRNARLRGLGLTVNLLAVDGDQVPWFFDISGAFTTTKGGLVRTDTVWKSLGRAHVLANKGKAPVVLLTSHLPRGGSEGDVALRAAGMDAFFDAIEMLSDEGRSRLRTYAEGGRHEVPLAGFWTEADVAGRRR